MANVGGNPVSWPNTGHPYDIFRQGQAVQYVPTDPANKVSGTSVTFSVTQDSGPTNSSQPLGNTEGLLTFSIVDNGTLGNSFALAWAMTCANDIIIGQVTLPPGEQFNTPLPAAFPLFAGGLGLIGFLGSRRRKKLMAKTAA